MNRGTTDIVIAGGGHTGLALALALRSAAPTMGVTVVDAERPGSDAQEGRYSAIAPAARRMLEALGVWPTLAGDAQPIHDMVVTDSRMRDVVRPVFLTFADLSERPAPVAHMVSNAALTGTLGRRALEAGAAIIAPETVADFTVQSTTLTAKLAGGEEIRTPLLVAADGVRSRLRELAGIGTVNWSYRQSGIVVTVSHERPHHGRAEEHFLPGGPFAILPLSDDADGTHRSSLVWTEPTATAARLVAGDAVVFAVELERRFGHHLGAVAAIDQPKAFPLGLTLARSFVAPRLALAGDAAHGIHPIAGQGLNLGLRDVAALAETVVEAHRVGIDIGSLAVLRDYERWRRFDTVQMGMAMDGLNRLFSNDNPALRLVRDVGLGAVDRLPGLKRLFMREAAGAFGEVPRLLKGEAI
jgi:2-octaprenyl-6-methoxyphenol hydroxylase